VAEAVEMIKFDFQTGLFVANQMICVHPGSALTVRSVVKTSNLG